MEMYQVPVLGDSPQIEVEVPGSKSITNRALLMAAMAEGETVLSGVLFSEDSLVFIQALRDLGFSVKRISKSAKNADKEILKLHTGRTQRQRSSDDNVCVMQEPLAFAKMKCTGMSESVAICGRGGRIPKKEASIYVGSAGTAARFLTAFVAMAKGTYRLDASEQMRKRPMKELLDALRQMGAVVRCPEGEDTFPLEIVGIGERRGEAEISLNIDRSSQFLSAVLMTAPLCFDRLSVTLTGSRSARSYVEMTEQMMKQFGHPGVRQLSEQCYEVTAAGYLPQDYVIEPDVSAACYFYAMAAATGGSACVKHMRQDSLQGDMKFLYLLEEMGCRLEWRGGQLYLQGPPGGRLHGVSVDMSDFSDQVLTLAAISPYADGPVVVHHVAHIRGQECDRIHAVAVNLRSMGVACQEREDGFTIEPSQPSPAVIQTFQDHRVAMAFAVSGVRTSGIQIENPQCCKKTFEHYFEILDQISGRSGNKERKKVMKNIMELLQDELKAAFTAAGYEESYAKVTTSNRPDLCQFQCSGALAAAKQYHKAPLQIAEDVVERMQGSPSFQSVMAQAPGFINMTLSNVFLSKFIEQMRREPLFGCEQAENPQTIVIDYGGANVAKPLHVGHLRSAIIGESIKRTARYLGHKVIGDAHLGDWGLQMGLIITELKKRQPDLVYFDESYTGEYPKEAPFTITDLEEIYPCANAYSKEHPEYKEEAQQATAQLQDGRRGYLALWQHIIDISVSDLRRLYDRLNVAFDLWKKESDAQPYIPDMVKQMKEDGYAHLDEGALVVDVKEETDTKEIPPCMILKSNGATLYNTTDLATIVERRQLFDPDKIIYVVDKRQSLYFTQVFRCARKTGIIGGDVDLIFVGFGTMNGKDGKPFKTRDGGVLRLEKLLSDVTDSVREKMADRDMAQDVMEETAEKIGLAAIKYGDLSNQASKDYVFDMERFTSFEGNTGPYILYTIVRIKSLMNKVREQGIAIEDEAELLPAHHKTEVDVMLALSRWKETVETAYAEQAPHKICQFVYELSDAFNKFYHENKIITNGDTEVRQSWIQLCRLTGQVLETAIGLLGLSAPERM